MSRDEPQTYQSRRDQTGFAGEDPDLGSSVTIDLDEFDLARRDRRLLALLEMAELEGARVEREGRRRW